MGLQDGPLRRAVSRRDDRGVQGRPGGAVRDCGDGGMPDSSKNRLFRDLQQTDDDFSFIYKRSMQECNDVPKFQCIQVG